MGQPDWVFFHGTLCTRQSPTERITLTRQRVSTPSGASTPSGSSAGCSSVELFDLHRRLCELERFALRSRAPAARTRVSRPRMATTRTPDLQRRLRKVESDTT